MESLMNSSLNEALIDRLREELGQTKQSFPGDANTLENKRILCLLYVHLLLALRPGVVDG